MMKGEYQEEEDHEQQQQGDISNSTPQSTSSTHLFSNFQSHPKFLSPPPHFLPPHPYPHPHPHHPQQQFQSTEITPVKPSKKPKTTPTPTTSSEDGTGGTIELSHSRRPRGRPPGSKNRPKPAIIITREPDPSTSMSPYILELPSGSDLVDSLTRFTRRRNIGLCVLTATGVVENVTLKQPSTGVQGGTVTFHGRFDVLSLQACLLVEGSKTVSFGSNCGMGVFTISLGGPQGQIVGGKVVGPLVCCGTVYVVATSFNNPSYCRLPLEGDGDRVTVTAGDGDGVDGEGSGTQVSLYSGGGGGHEVMWGPAVSGGGGGGGSSRPQSSQQQQQPRY
ncbi:AT-hook motif nuclear-localized protein 20-like [Silene latifolia]|uniref:AT-hook motif nuclear-localized protein 20-like n=1 Tax=Silene latifolia TaxID=37657 RepID=UPI003D76C46C